MSQRAVERTYPWRKSGCQDRDRPRWSTLDQPGMNMRFRVAQRGQMLRNVWESSDIRVPLQLSWLMTWAGWMLYIFVSVPFGSHLGEWLILVEHIAKYAMVSGLFLIGMNLLFLLGELAKFVRQSHFK